MKKIRKLSAVLVFALCAMLCLSACGSLDLGGGEEEDVTLLVRGNIDVIYQGKYDPDYLEMVDSTEAEAERDYLDGLAVEAEYFAYYFGIVDPDYGETYDILDADLQNELVELYREIYSHSKYEVQTAVEQEDGSYTVRVLVDPINVIQLAVDAYEDYEPLNEFWAKYADTDFGAMSDEDYLAYTHEYGYLMVQLVRDQMPNLGYMEQKSQSIQVQEVDGVLSMNDDDWGIFDSYVIYYP